MAQARFYSDTNLDGFLQSISHHRVEAEADSATRVVELERLDDAIIDEVSRWDGEIIE